MKTSEQLLKLVRGGEMEQALAYFRGEQRKVFRAFLPTIDKLVEDSVASSDRYRGKAAELGKTTKIELAVVIALTAAISLAIGFMLYRTVVVPLGRMRAAVVHVVEDRDFTQPIGVAGRDEIADTAAAVDRLTAAIRGTLHEFTTASDQVATLAAELASAATEVSENSHEQSKSSSSMVACVEQLTASIHQVSDTATNVAKVSHDSDAAAAQGGGVMVQTIDQVRQIGERIKETAVSVQALGQASREITSIVQVIREVADQTNLLALNAAIEAARAGEQGRGFAVVADEVRKLAERTAMATQEITAKIAAIQNGSEAACVQMDLSVNQVGKGMAEADEAVAAVGRIKSNVARVDAEVSSISAALKEQGKASTTIAQQVEEVARASDGSCRGAEDAARLSRRLVTLSSTLRNAVACYRT
jgi:methyl-accepting chemotaxis protein